MNLHKIISELQAERDRLDHAIDALERLSRQPAVRHGRLPGQLQRGLAESGPVLPNSMSLPQRGQSPDDV